ncbi:unnamed protein product [Caretta caretta]
MTARQVAIQKEHMWVKDFCHDSGQAISYYSRIVESRGKDTTPSHLLTQQQRKLTTPLQLCTSGDRTKAKQAPSSKGARTSPTPGIICI